MGYAAQVDYLSLFRISMAPGMKLSELSIYHPPFNRKEIRRRSEVRYSTLDAKGVEKLIFVFRLATIYATFVFRKKSWIVFTVRGVCSFETVIIRGHFPFNGEQKTAGVAERTIE